jgi:hypothetical protein
VEAVYIMEQALSKNTILDGHGRRVARAGVLLFAISLVNGFLIHSLPLTRLALSAHLVGLIGSTFLIGLSAWWPRLHQSLPASRLLAILSVYGFVGGWLVYVSAATFAAGGMFPLLSGGTHGGAAAEALIGGAILTVAIALFLMSAMIWRGLGAPQDRDDRPAVSEERRL